MTECKHSWEYSNYLHKRECALCGQKEILIYEPTDESCTQYIPQWIEEPKPQIDLKEFKIYIDGKRIR